MTRRPQTMGDRTWENYHAPLLRAERLARAIRIFVFGFLAGAIVIALAALASKAAANTRADLAQAEQMQGW